MKKSIVTRWVAAAAVVAAPLAVPAAPAAAAGGDHVVINELYANGTGAGAAYKTRYVELYNPTDVPVGVQGWSLQYKSATGTTYSGKLTLPDRTIAPHGYLLVAGSANSTGAGADVPGVDVSGTLAPSGSNGVVALSKSSATLAATLTDPDLVDLVGYGTANLFEGPGAAASGGSTTSSITRDADHVDSDRNNADFSLLTTPTPCGTAGCPVVEPPADPTVQTIEEVQGTGATSPFAGKQVTTKGVVTAVYRTGGYNGAFIQNPGTGGQADDASHGLFVFGSAFAAAVERGDYVEVTGGVSEFGGTTAVPATLTELTTGAGKFTVLDEPVAAPVVTPAAFPLTAAQKERLEGMLVAPQGTYTITNNFTTNTFGEIGLAPGTEPFDTPTNVVRPGAEAKALAARNAEALVTLDDGASLSFTSRANQSTALPWLTPGNEVRVGQTLTFDDPVVLDFRNSLWKLQPTEQLVAGGDEPVDLGPSTRTAGPADVGGQVTIGTFNVLNYFTTTGVAYDAGPGVCTFFDDRQDNHMTTDECGDPSSTTGNGPRGAADDANLARQQAKIVEAINTLDADVVSLEEIENSAKFGDDRNAALDTLVAALNADAGRVKWAAVASPPADQLPDLAGQDLIRTAFIYQPSAVSVVGASKVLADPAFDNAREPLAQAFKVAGGPDASTFAVIVNHFKSKGSGSGVDADQGDGQGAGNASRKAQATALVAFADDFAADAGTDKVFLTGDFNAYNREDPVAIIEAAGFVNVPAARTDKETYQFDGAVGSLDHVFASPAADRKVTGADIWNINSYESVAREYSRYNANVTDFYRPDPYRASDHDPEVVGFDALPSSSSVTASAASTVRSGDPLDVAVRVTGDEPAPGGTVTVTEGGTELGSGTLTDGTAEVTVDDLSIGSHTLTVTYAGDADHAPSSTTVKVSVVRALSRLAATVDPSTYGQGAVVHVTTDPGATGLVYVAEGGTVLGTGVISGGQADLRLPTDVAPGAHDLVVYYGGSGTYAPTDVDLRLEVAKAPTVLRKVSVSPTKIVKGRTKPYVELSVTADGFVVDGGTVTLKRAGSSKPFTGTVEDGKVRVRLAAFSSSGAARTVTATYSGNAVALGSTTSFTVRVVSR